MLHPHGTSQQWLPLSRSYGYILPSSLTRVLPRTLGFSPRIPVSVYGTGGSSLTRSFSRQCGVNNFARISAHSASRLRLSVHGFAYAPPYTLTHALPFACLPALLCHSIAQTITTGTGISTSCPSPTLSAPKIPGAKVRNRSCGCIRKVYGVGERSHRVEVELEGSVDLWEVRMLV